MPDAAVMPPPAAGRGPDEADEAPGFVARAPEVVSDADWQKYLETAESFAADAFRSERRGKRLFMGATALLSLAVVGVSAAVVALATTTTHHLHVVDRNPLTGEVRVLEDLMAKAGGFDRDPLALKTDNATLERYVEMREGWNEADAETAFNAVACMSDKEGEQRDFQRWYHGEEAPQGVYQNLGYGYRRIKVNAPAITQGFKGDGPRSARRVSVPITIFDHVKLGQPPVQRQARVEFTVRRDLSYFSNCNLRALVVKDYVRQVYRSAE